MNSISNGVIAAAYLIIPLTLLPLLQTARREIQLNLVLAVAFVFCCGVGHLLMALQGQGSSWDWVTAAVSWLAVGALLKSQAQLRYLGETFQLLQISWDQAITGKTLWQRSDDDLTLLKINATGTSITQNLIQPGERLCEQMPSHRQQVYPYQAPLIDLYLHSLDSGQSRRLEYQYDGEFSGWYLTIVTPLSTDLLYITFSEISGIVHDPLTGIYNRRILDLDLERWRACLYIDLDRFKLINDQRGQQIGDRVLTAVAIELQTQAQHYDGIAVRDGGDEFLLLLPEMEPEQVYELATDVLQTILAIDIQGVGISASIGIASGVITAFEGDTPISRLQQAAETALREAKRNRRSDLPQHRICVWDSVLAQRRLRQITLEAYLQQRQSETEFWLAYQPICQMQTGAIVGAEALIRWTSPQLGAISPGEFIPVAEQTGLIYRISDWVLGQAMEQLVAWQQIAPEFSLSINISPMELEDDDFIERVLQRVDASGVDAEHLGLEITERGIYRNLDRYLQSLQALRDLSVRLKVDDFGTGQSGLAQLLQFRFDEVKVDRYFIPTHADDLEKLAICEAIAKLSEGIGFGLVAEGVEHLYQRDLLRSLNYAYGQGYLFARPMPATVLTTLLQDRTHLG